jgi:Na+-transporting NADH:ubiquinone oxidoreductase subunit NqrC
MINTQDTARYKAYTLENKLDLLEASLYKMKMEMKNIEEFYTKFVRQDLLDINSETNTSVDYNFEKNYILVLHHIDILLKQTKEIK